MISFQIGTIFGELSYFNDKSLGEFERDRYAYDSLYKIFELIYDNVDMLREDHVANSSICVLCIR